MLKKIKQKILFHLITKTAYLLLYGISFTVKFKEADADALEKIGRNNVIFALWHNRFFIAPYFASVFKKKKNLAALASRSRDGQMISAILKMFNFSVVCGSSKKGGDVALKQLSRKITDENCATAITVDGPTGPIYQVKPGVIKLASLTGAPIIPLSYNFNSYFCIKKSWDKFLIPKPFTTCNVYFGEPIYIEKDISKDDIPAAAEKIKQSLNSITEQQHPSL